MLLLEVNYIVQHIAQIFGKPLSMTLEQFNSLCKTAQDDLFKEFADGYSIGNGAYVDSRVSAALNPFKNTTAIVQFSSTTVHGVTGSTAILNPDIYKLLSVFGYKTPNTFNSGAVTIDIIDDHELSYRISNVITEPSFDYPVCIVDINNSTIPYFHIIPSGMSGVEISWLKKPTAPELKETLVGGVRTTGTGTVELQFSSIYHTDIVRKILGYLGVSVGNGDIVQVMANQDSKEK